MGKKDKKDPAKKFALQAKKEAKADKKAQKRLLKQNKKERDALSPDDSDYVSTKQQDDDENDIDAFLQSYQQQNLELSTPVVEKILADSDKDGDYSKKNEVPMFPYPPRGNFTLSLCPTSNNLYLYGGEYYDGIENLVFDEMLCWDPDAVVKNDYDEEKENDDTTNNSNNEQAKIGLWKRIISPQPRPPARCSHSTVYYNNALYVFGGEFASAENYHHYKDLWKFDIKTNLWTEIKPRNRGGPTPRSGHRAIVWRHYMIIFGGFFEAVRETPRWYNDLHVYDFSTNAWIECKYSSLASLPPERSAFNFGIFTGTDVAFVSGGYCKLKNPAPGTKAEGLTYSDSWALHLRNLENGKPPTWERLSRKGEYPSQRSGTACAIWKNKMLLFGGVQDEETDNHKLNSVFYDDLFALDMERRRWFKLNMKKATAGRRRRKKRSDEDKQVDVKEDSDDSDDEDENLVDGEAISNGWDLDMLRANMFAFIDAEGNIVYEKIEPDEDDNAGKALPEVAEEDEGYDVDAGGISDLKQQESVHDPSRDEINAVEQMLDQCKVSQPDDSTFKPLIGKSEVMTLNKEGKPEAVSRKKPLPRINSQIVVRGNTLFIYGGILEVGDREITLDDCWSIDLQKREEWKCVWNGSMHKQVWKGAESDNESYISTDRGTGGMESDNEDDFDEFNEELMDDLTEEAKASVKAARKEAIKAAKKEKMKGIREEIQALNEEFNLGDSDMTPIRDEDLATFYARTAMIWEKRAVEILNQTESSSADNYDLSLKEIKREGFNLAKTRYAEVKPALERLEELENTQNKKEKKKSSKKEKKKKDKK